MQLNEAIIQRIVEISEERQLTILRWSMLAGVTPSTLYSVMSRPGSCPRIQTLKLLCDAVDMKLSEFFDADCINEAQSEQ